MQVKPRLLNVDGTNRTRVKNVEGKVSRSLMDSFTMLINQDWLFTLTIASSIFIISWIFFACLWCILQVIYQGNLSIVNDVDNFKEDDACIIHVDSFITAFLFSVETQFTIGYGFRYISSHCAVPAAIILVFQCLVSAFLDSIAIALVIAKVSRPRRRAKTIQFSRIGCMYTNSDGCRVFAVRVGDLYSNSDIPECHVRMYLITTDCIQQSEDSQYGATSSSVLIQNSKSQHLMPVKVMVRDLDVGYDKGYDRILLVLPWIIEHKVDETSPLYGVTKEEFEESFIEIVVILEGSVEQTGSTTQVKTSYNSRNIVWDQKFKEIVSIDHKRSCLEVDFAQFHSTELPES